MSGGKETNVFVFSRNYIIQGHSRNNAKSVVTKNKTAFKIIRQFYVVRPAIILLSTTHTKLSGTFDLKYLDYYD